jgi:circadian clock protein KaiC
VYAAELHDIFSSRIASPSEGLSPLLESLIVMRFSEMHARVRRVISVLKLRDSDFDSTLSEFEITHRGLRMKATLANAEDVLTGTAHDRASTITTKVTATKTRDERTAKRRSKKR